jgi:hypothetical protein
MDFRVAGWARCYGPVLITESILGNGHRLAADLSIFVYDEGFNAPLGEQSSTGNTTGACPYHDHIVFVLHWLTSIFPYSIYHIVKSGFEKTYFEVYEQREHSATPAKVTHISNDAGFLEPEILRPY